MDFCFNELCLETKATDQYQADGWIQSLIVLLKQAYSIDKELPILRTQTGLYSLSLGNDFTIATWLKSSLADREKRAFLLTIKDRSPYLDGELDKFRVEEASRLDFFYKNQRVLGLGYTWLLDGVAISFPNAEEWACAGIEIQVDTLSDDFEIQSANQNVNHVSQIHHLEMHAEHFKSLGYYYQEMPHLVALREKSTRLFSFLSFGDEALKWLESHPLSKQQFHLIIRNLYNLNRFFEQQVANENYNLSQIPSCSNESESTRNQYSQERFFWFGVDQYYCEWHLKIHSLNVRIHFKPDFENKIAYVGYIGRHLRTTLYD